MSQLDWPSCATKAHCLKFKTCKIKMKKVFFLLSSALLLSIFTFTACKKDNSTPVEHLESGSQTKFWQNKTPLKDLIANPEDKAEEKLNEENVKIAQVLLKLSTNKEFVKFVTQEARKDEGRVTYEAIFKQMPHLKDLFKETIIARRFGLTPASFNPAVDYDVAHQNFGYNYMINVPNYEVAEEDKSPVISPELEVEDFPESDDFDVIFGWETDVNGSISEVNITERAAMVSDKPILVTSMDVIRKIIENTPNFSERKETNGKLPSSEPKTTNFVHTNKVRLAFHYDKSRFNELYCVGVRALKDNMSEIMRFQDNFGGSGSNSIGTNRHEFKVGEIHKNNTGSFQASTGFLGTLMPMDKEFYKMTILPLADEATHFLYYNYYERDWYSNRKPLGTAKFDLLPNTPVIVLEGKRRFQHHWYAFDPGPDCGRDPQGTLSHLRNLRFPTHIMRSNFPEFTDLWDRNESDDPNENRHKGEVFYKRVTR